MTIHDPDVALTDLGLAALGAYLSWRLWSASAANALQRTGAVLMAALAGAAFWGAVFHAFLPAGTATLPGFLVWIPVALSIVVAASALLWLSLRLLLPRLGLAASRLIVVAYAICFAVVVLLINESFTSIVHFYLPALVLLLLAATREAVGGHQGWGLVATGLGASLLAAILQQLRVSIHPTYFDHNALYHVVQGIALVVLYAGWRRASSEDVCRRRAV